MPNFTRLVLSFILFFAFSVSIPLAQTKKNNAISPATLEEMKQAATRKAQMRSTSIFKNYPIRSVGPTVMGGRIVDIEASRKDKKLFYVAYASGGVFKTTNNGTSFSPIFDNQARLTIGDIALSPSNENVLWVGTGENNSSRSSYAGFGVYRSEDAGKTWAHCGLENTQHIGRIIAHPTDEQTAWVASIGALYSKNTDRGIYKTTDGGKTWRKTLFINDSTGVIDLAVNPQNPKQVWATAWERGRKAWDFKENGVGSGLYYSEDGGEAWTKITTGLPESKWMGRMGLDICASQPNVLYLTLDNQEEVKAAESTDEEEEEKTKYGFKDFEHMTKEKFMSIAEADLDTFLLKNSFPKKYTGRIVKEEVQKGKYPPIALARYFNDANNSLFDTEVRGAEVYRSDDFGKSWQKVNSYPLEGVFYTYGYYFGQIRVAPDNPNQIYIFGVPFLRSDDGGKTYQSIAPFNQVHADHHALWIDHQDSKRILLGNDGGLYLSYDSGNRWQHIDNVAAGQFYTVAVDMEKPYNIYGGLQDNGVYFGSSKSVPNESKDWEMINGGDGMYIQVNPKNNQLRYSGFQFGNYWRIDNGKFTRITPTHDIGEAPLRFNWRTPVLLSKHNPDIVYFCAQRVYRSFNQGAAWEAISPDLTKNRPQSNVPYATISSFCESPLKFNLLYAGTDDGNVHISKNGGITWELISQNLPPDRWISAIYASTHDEKTVFVSLTGYRSDEIKAYIYKSTDFGKTWTAIIGNLPHEAVNVISQDAVNPDLLYAGTDQGAYISLNGGANWELLTGDFPNVATYDLIVHPREQELVLATHGRSIYVMDVKPLQKLKGAEAQKNIIAYKPEKIRFNKNWGRQRIKYNPVTESEITLLYYLKNNSSELNITVKDEKGNILQTLTGEKSAGFQQIKWNLKTQSGSYLPIGKYTIEYSGSGQTEKTTLEIQQ